MSNGMVKKDRLKDLLVDGVQEGIYPGAVILVGQTGEIIFFHEAGHRSLSPDVQCMHKDTIFDLASLTKPLATTLALMKLVDQDKIDLDQPLSELITTLPLIDKKNITPRLLLNHSAGFLDWGPFYLDLGKHRIEERRGLLRSQIIGKPLTYMPGKECLYSDLGFMILEWVIEIVSEMPMHRFIEHNFYRPLLLKKTFLSTESSSIMFEKENFAATEDCHWRKKVMQGQVHDENAFALGGYSGHAGLFGIAEDIYRIVNMLVGHHRGERCDFLRPGTVREFFTRQNLVKGSSWALGWDTPSLENSSTGKHFSHNSVGHLGFTGTSIWMDLDRDIIVIFLTNRIHPTRNNEKIKAFRPRLHDCIIEELGMIT